MTKTLTEQWRDGTLDGGVYYLLLRDGTTTTDKTVYIVGEKQLRWHYSSFDFVKEVLEPVPSYDEFKQLVSKTEQLEKRLEIATKALKEYADSSNWYETDDFGISAVDQFACDDYGYNIAQQALKEMEGVK